MTLLPLITAAVGLLILAALPALTVGYDRRLSQKAKAS